MFSHIMVGVNDLERARRFYDALLGALGVPAGSANPQRFFWHTPGGTFVVTIPINGAPATAGNGSTYGFAGTSVEQIDAAHAAGIAAGGVSCEDPPGWRSGDSMYLAYLRDPDGNKICLVHRAAKS